MQRRTALRGLISYIARFRSVVKQETDFLRGYAAGLGSYRATETDTSGIGKVLKASLMQSKYGPWRVNSPIMCQTLPKESDYVMLDAVSELEKGMF